MVASGARTDQILLDIAAYVTGGAPLSDEAYGTARLCLADSLGCAMLALEHEECEQLLGPVVPGAELPGGARVPGTSFELDPVRAGFNLGTMIRWLDYNDTWLAAEWGHPSDNFGGILMLADYLSRQRTARGEAPLRVRDVLTAGIQAYEVQGVLALENSFNRLGLDHVILVRVATTAVATALLGGSRADVAGALSNAWVDGGALRVYRHAPNVGWRKSWAAGDATSRGVWHALMALRGAQGYPTAMSAPTWGFDDVVNRGNALAVGRPYGSYVMENILFKISFPAEFHAQTAVEAAITLHPLVRERLNQIDRIRIETQESALRIIDKRGPLHNAADRDHCLQYATAIGLIHGALTAEDYEDAAAQDPRIDALRDRMELVEEPRYSRDYLDPEKRSVANAIEVIFHDGTRSPREAVEYPIGHRSRRAEGIPLLYEKLRSNLATRLSGATVETIVALFREPGRLDDMPVHDLVDLFTPLDQTAN